MGPIVSVIAGPSPGTRPEPQNQLHRQSDSPRESDEALASADLDDCEMTGARDRRGQRPGQVWSWSGRRTLSVGLPQELRGKVRPIRSAPGVSSWIVVVRLRPIMASTSTIR